MTNAYQNELARAHGRDDIVELSRLLELHHRWSSFDGNRDNFLREHDELDEYFRLDTDPDKALAFVILAASTYDEPDYLFLTAAGPLENLLRAPSPSLLDRVVAEARKTARFRWMLTGVYPHAIEDEAARQIIVKAIGDVRETDPMPPAPWT